MARKPLKGSPRRSHGRGAEALDPGSLRDLLRRHREGTVDTEDVVHALTMEPYRDLGFARLDTHRRLRKGFPEVVLGLGKSPEQVASIVAELASDGAPVLVTKASVEAYRSVKKRVAEATFAPASGVISVQQEERPPTGRGTILVVAAGTSDYPVAEEAILTSRVMGNRTEQLLDVGVAGLHRLLGESRKLLGARVVIVVAGMEGALPSVVGGLVSAPVIAVPTSTGYGTSFQGLTALLGMLNSCASGVTVVNIDNGFGAAYAASLINHLP